MFALSQTAGAEALPYLKRLKRLLAKIRFPRRYPWHCQKERQAFMVRHQAGRARARSLVHMKFM